MSFAYGLCSVLAAASKSPVISFLLSSGKLSLASYAAELAICPAFGSCALYFGVAFFVDLFAYVLRLWALLASMSWQ